MTRIALSGLIIVTSIVIALDYTAVQAYGFALIAFGLGVTWLALEMREVRAFGTVFFLAFLILTILRSLAQASVVIPLLALTTNLAAWDLSRFRARISGEAGDEVVALLETRHLQKLAVTALAGFAIALLPVFIQLSLNFVILISIILGIMVVLRQSVLLINGKSSSHDTPPHQ